MKIVFFTFVLCCCGINRASGESLKLSDYLEEVKTVNPSIEAFRLRALSLEDRVGPASSLDDPFIAIGLDEIAFEGGGAQVRRYQVSQTIPFPGKLFARADVAEKKAEFGKFEAETMARQVKVLAIQVYLRAGFNQETIKLNQRIQKVIEEVSASAKARYTTGGSSHHEWLLAKLELSVLKVEALRLQRNQIILHALFNELRNKPSSTPVELEGVAHQAVLENDLEFKVDFDQQPEVKTLNAFKQAAESELKLAKLSYAPDFVIQGMAMEPTKKAMMPEPANWGVMVGITIPLFFWNKQADLVDAGKKENQAAILEYQSLLNRLNTEFTDAKQQLKTSRDVVALYQNDVIPITEIAVKNARSSYIAKTLPLSQLLEALKAQRVQELELLGAQIDVILSKTRMQELLSAPPILKLAPSRPTLFGSDMSSSNEMGSATINMGNGMSGPTRKQNSSDQGGNSPGGMGGM